MVGLLNIIIEERFWQKARNPAREMLDTGDTLLKVVPWRVKVSMLVEKRMVNGSITILLEKFIRLVFTTTMWKLVSGSTILKMAQSVPVESLCLAERMVTGAY